MSAAVGSAAIGNPLLMLRGVKTYYGNVIALKGVDVDVHEGEIVALIGANGAGKSTLMMTVFGNPRASEGEIRFAGRDITAMATHEIAKLPPRQVAIALTGSQGEPMAALSRVAVDSHRWAKVEPGDEVVISARIIPGNEKSIFRMIGRQQTLQSSIRVCFDCDVSTCRGNDSPQCGQTTSVSQISSIRKR